MRKIFYCAAWALFVLLPASLLAQDRASVSEYEKSFPTYPFSDPDPVPSFSKIYPYFRYDGFTDKKQDQQWKVVELQNRYIQVLILPQVGGKIWAAIEKKDNKPFIYYNHSVKFRDIAMRGPWTSGGIEANFGIIGHTPNCATPVDYITRENADGSVSCIIGVLDLLSRSQWRVEVNLPADKAYFTTRTFWYNNTAWEQPYYHWMNAGLPAAGNLEFIFPGNAYLGHKGEHGDWPVNKRNGRHINFYDQNNFGGYKSYHVFGAYTNFFGAYWHKKDRGMVHYAAYDEKPGKKIWIWGLSRQGMIWEKLLTDTDGQYVELQSGRLFNQNQEESSFTPFKHRNFAPFGSDHWTEYWYPVVGTKGIVKANQWGAANLYRNNKYVYVSFSPVQEFSDSIVLQSSAGNRWARRIHFKPLQNVTDSFPLAQMKGKLRLMIGNHLLDFNEAESDSLSRPMDAPADFDWQSPYGLYLMGKELLDQKMYEEAAMKWDTALQKDSNFLPALVELSAMELRNNRLQEAFNLALRALRINTMDASANYYYGLIAAALNRFADARDGFSIASLSPAYRSPAYTAMSRLFAVRQEWSSSLHYAQQALIAQSDNMTALEEAALAYRNLGEAKAWDSVLTKIERLDPLSHFVAFERYLVNPEEHNRELFINGIKNEWPAQTYLELAMYYYNAGAIKDALAVLESGPKESLLQYWTAYLKYRLQQPFKEALEKAAAGNTAFQFPWRNESADMLSWAAAQTSDWKPLYWQALMYRHQNRASKADSCFLAVGDRSDDAAFYAARAGNFMHRTVSIALHSLMKAIELAPDDWRYLKMQVLYLIENEQYAVARDKLSAYYTRHPDNYIMGMLLAKTLLLTKAYKQGDQLLSKLNIIPFEGATEGRVLYREAKLMQAVQLMKSNRLKDALRFVKEARLWPEHLGVGKPYDQDVDERLEDWMESRIRLKQGDLARSEALEEKIMQFDPQDPDKQNNLLIPNQLLTAWVIEKRKGRGAASDWLQEQMKKEAGDALMLWVQQSFRQGAPVSWSGKPDGSISVIQALFAE